MEAEPIAQIEAIMQNAQSVAVHKEVESARLMTFHEIEESHRIKQIQEVVEFNAEMNAEAMPNQGNYFDLYV